MATLEFKRASSREERDTMEERTAEDGLSMESTRVTLILPGDYRIVANREKLVRSSHYFASLFSTNFNDYLRTDININYDISPNILQDFINWTAEANNEEGAVTDDTKCCLDKYKTGNNYADLMDLLELSVLFMAENLSERLTVIIVEHWLLIKNVLSIWLLAHDLNLRSLRDVAFAVCLDRLAELPVSSLLKLSQTHFVQLVGNVNARSCNISFLQDVTMQWLQRNANAGILPGNMAVLRSVQRLIAGSEDELDLGKKAYLHCVVGSKIGENGLTRKACVFKWNGERLSTLIDETDRDCEFLGMVKDLVGMQVVGRGFSIYFVGGERGLGTGRFNTVIWRYCLITKKCYKFSSLLEPRRHMAVEFIDNNLMAIAGGVGRHRLKLSTMNILNIHTGEWTKAADVPEEFTEVPSTCIVGSKLLLYKSALHVYDLKTDTWSTLWPVSGPEIGTSTQKLNVAQFLMCYKNMLYICDSTSDNRTCLWMIDNISNPMPRMVFEFSTLHQIQVTNGSQLIGFACDREIVTVEVAMIRDNNVYVCKLYTCARDSDILVFEARMGSFNVIDPECLYRQIS